MTYDVSIKIENGSLLYLYLYVYIYIYACLQFFNINFSYSTNVQFYLFIFFLIAMSFPSQFRLKQPKEKKKCDKSNGFTIKRASASGSKLLLYICSYIYVYIVYYCVYGIYVVLGVFVYMLYNITHNKVYLSKATHYNNV